MYETLEEIVYYTTASHNNNEHGFTISGGVDRPVSHGDTSVYITHIVEGGAAEADGRWKTQTIY